MQTHARAGCELRDKLISSQALGSDPDINLLVVVPGWNAFVLRTYLCENYNLQTKHHVI